MRFISSLSRVFSRWSAKWIPSSLAIALLLTIVVYALGIAVAGRSFYECFTYWLEGFSVLLEFGMQMTLILMTGFMVASAPPVSRLLNYLAGLPRTPRQTLVMMSVVSLLAHWIHWGVGSIVGVIMVRFLIERQRDVDYRVLVAVGYFGMSASWHVGISGSAPLLVATPGNPFESEIGILPLSQTVLTTPSILLVIFVGVILTLLAPLLQSGSAEGEGRITEEGISKLVALTTQKEVPALERKFNFSHWVDHQRIFSLGIGLTALLCLGIYLASNGFAITLNTVNFGFFFLALVLHRSLSAFFAAAQDGVKLVHGIIIQFPLYAGIFGIIQGSGLTMIIGNAFVAVATPASFPLIIYYYSCLMNYLVPSGGGQFILQASYMISAAERLGVPFRELLVPYAWGDMTTNFLQPFWCLPLLTAAQLDFKDIMGYLMIPFLTTLTIVSVAIYFFL